MIREGNVKQCLETTSVSVKTHLNASDTVLLGIDRKKYIGEYNENQYYNDEKKHILDRCNKTDDWTLLQKELNHSKILSKKIGRAHV